MRRAAEVVFGSQAAYRIGVGTYDQDKVGLGTCMVQKNDSGNEGKYVGPMPVGLIRPFEFATPIPGVFPWAMQWSNSNTAAVDWVFLADNAAAAATRRLMMATLDRLTGAFAIQGFITITFPSGATNNTIRAMRMTYDKHTVGTVGVSGTAVTGASTTWLTDRACIGNRIGFGSTDPTQISTWYEISAMASDTSITLTASAGTISSGTPYVIEDLRSIIVTTNATTTNGGLFVVKGLRPETFASGGTAIGAASTTDNVRACFWLADATTETNTVASGMGLEPVTDKQNHVAWVLDTLANPVAFKYNLRAALTLTAGKDTTTLLLKTGSGGAVTGTTSQANNCRYAQASHGPGSGIGCLYFTTTTRVYRSAQTSGITGASTTWLSGGDVMTEVPPGSANTFAASALMNSIEYAGTIDKFLIAVNSTTSPFNSYLTAYNASASQLDRIFGVDTRQIDQSSVDATTTPHPSMTGASYSAWVEGGMAYLATIGATAILNRVYAVPLSSDWEYSAASVGYVIAPRIACPDIDKFKRAFAQEAQIVGGATSKNLGRTTLGWRMSYRTAGISDNSGSWTLLDGSGDMAGIAGAAYIQFKLEFRTLEGHMIPARICNVGITYDDVSTESHYQFSATKSDATNKRFAWRFSTAFGGSVPALRVRLYDAVTGSQLVDDNTASPTGTFEKSTDGTTFVAWTNADKGNETTYLRYTPASLADSINVRPVLTLN
jgi:hypothetical protein